MTAPRLPEMLAVLVLYGRAAEESPAFLALQAFTNSPGNRGRIALSIFDNSPTSSSAPADYEGRYVAYPWNPGLARPYNEALREAEDREIPWLMLLDQDTNVSRAYLDEVLDEATAEGPVALVPRLLSNGNLLSPHVLSYWPGARPLTTTVQGLADRRLHYFNSGAVLRVGAIRKIGGFPEEFPLDYLDHAVFYQLQQLSLPILILHNGLEHHLSSTDPDREDDPAWIRREKSTLYAAVKYYSRYERVHKSLQHRAALLMASLKHVLTGSPARAKRFLQAALLRTKGVNDA